MTDSDPADWLRAELAYLESFEPSRRPTWFVGDSPDFDKVFAAAELGDDDARRLLWALAVFSLETGEEPLGPALAHLIASHYRRLLDSQNPRAIFPVRQTASRRAKTMEAERLAVVDEVLAGRGLRPAARDRKVSDLLQRAKIAQTPKGAIAAVAPDAPSLKKRRSRARKAGDKS